MSRCGRGATNMSKCGYFFAPLAYFCPLTGCNRQPCTQIVTHTISKHLLTAPDATKCTYFIGCEMSFGIEWLICFGYDRMERITRDYSCSMAANVEVMSFRLFSLRCHSSTQPHTKKHSFNFSRSLQNYIVIECIESNRLDRLSAILCSRNWCVSVST